MARVDRGAEGECSVRDSAATASESNESERVSRLRDATATDVGRVFWGGGGQDDRVPVAVDLVAAVRTTHELVGRGGHFAHSVAHTMKKAGTLERTA
mmetsp:Transcript_4636/g.7435  ORF Transcript_4636/g.7435 Transcript_4636/m.7435 type:complete len:97 (+) Transcript_4636:381-671(+)